MSTVLVIGLLLLGLLFLTAGLFFAIIVVAGPVAPFASMNDPKPKDAISGLILALIGVAMLVAAVLL